MDKTLPRSGFALQSDYDKLFSFLFLFPSTFLCCNAHTHTHSCSCVIFFYSADWWSSAEYSFRRNHM